LTSKNFIHDPIQRTIGVPEVLFPLLKEKSVRRMQFIRQLGLKAFIDFPNAIHTRYSHVVGGMHLTGKVTDRLSDLQNSENNTDIAQTLTDNKNNLMGAGLLHDIDHGHFSHVLDYFLKEYCKSDHEKKASSFIEKFGFLESRGLNIKKIQEIIVGKLPFFSEVDTTSASNMDEH
jgi:HD superfamily phosphohydrolase